MALRQISHPASEVWSVLRCFEDLSWALGQGVSSFESTGSGVGMLRAATAPGDGGRIVEKLVGLDESAMTIEYVIVEGAIPSVHDYAARAQVRSRADGCEIEWDCRAEVDAPLAEQGQAVLDGVSDRMATLFAAQFEP
jgi:carbon monoxide dehydrogenase subunit G